ncbi:MAG: family 43 glycosylhydrolase [Planctomycetes bacterium]|nr:family 43 glycosylhydrolase [Planctomycetota bacterium]
MTIEMTGNPLLPGRGVTDPHVRIFGDRAYMYATHDRSPDNDRFIMDDWWVWSSPDLVHWRCECTLRPADIHVGPGFTGCWATDAAERNGRYYWYFSESAQVGVVVGDSPVGPWRDVLGRPMIPAGLVPVKAYDPGILIDDDGAAYIVFGVWDFYLARLAEDMISLAEPPRKLAIHNPEGPYGRGRTDDKAYLHRRGGIYYLSWGCYYAVSDNVYGPYECRGSILVEENVDPPLRYRDSGCPLDAWRRFGGADAPKALYDERVITFDRHGSFFQWHAQWYYICNDMSRSRNPFFRDSAIATISYRANGDIEPVRLETAGVCAAGR